MEGKDQSNESPESRKARIHMHRRRRGHGHRDRRSVAEVLDVEFTRFQVLRLAGGVYVVGLVVILLLTLIAMYAVGAQVFSMPLRSWSQEKALLTIAFFAMPVAGLGASLFLRILIESWVVLFRIAESAASIEKITRKHTSPDEN